MGQLDGKVAFITGAARGQGRSHALRLAQEGADIIAIDLAGQIDTVPYADVDAGGPRRRPSRRSRHSIAASSPRRPTSATSTGVKAAVDDGVAQLGRLDIVVANAGIFSFGTLEELTERGLERHDRRQPDRRLAHRQGRGPAYPGGRQRRLDRPHQLDRGPRRR